jgi:PEP-CTERM/exosortase A-associated glycosyltransferase
MNPRMQSLKILHILDHGAPLQSGYVFRSQSIFREQMKRGWHPVAITSPKQQASSKEPWQDNQEIAGVRYYRTRESPPGFLPLEGELRLMSSLARRIRQVAEIERPDLLHAHSPILNVFPALRVGRRMGIPVVYEIRAFWEDAAVDHGTFAEGSWRYRLIRGAETWACRHADHTAVLCQGIQQDLAKRGVPLDRLTAIRNGVDVDTLAPCPPDPEFQQAWRLSGKKLIGFIGSFYRYEGLDLLVQAFAKLAGRYPELVLLLLGGGEVEGELREQVRQLGLGERVLMPGRIPHGRVPGVYALMDLLVYPRNSMRLTELVTPLKPLEAMAMRKAVIASDIGGHRELIHDGETGLLFRAGDAPALTQTIATLLDDTPLRERLADRGRCWVVQEHSWRKTTAAYEDIYAQVLDRRASHARTSRVPREDAG